MHIPSFLLNRKLHYESRPEKYKWFAPSQPRPTASATCPGRAKDGRADKQSHCRHLPSRHSSRPSARTNTAISPRALGTLGPERIGPGSKPKRQPCKFEDSVAGRGSIV